MQVLRPTADAPPEEGPPAVDRRARTELFPPGPAPASASDRASEQSSPPPASHAAHAPEGTPFGRYVLLSELGRGGMGVVHRAFDCELRRVVALKTFLPEATPTPLQVERFLREARAAARLRHPGIVQVHDVGTSPDGRHYFTMDLIEGESLEAAGPKLPLRRVVEILRDAALALAAAHASGVVHRDVKPANILLDASGRAYLGDFGLAKEVAQTEGRGVTVAGAILGTPFYMSPEQARGRNEEIGPTSDLWSLGVILYEHLAGRPPFEGEGYLDTLRKVLEEEPSPPSRVAAAAGRDRRVHRDLETICLKCLEREPTRRYSGGAELAADLGRFLDGEPIHARTQSGVGRAGRWVRRRRLPVAATAALVLAGGVTGVSAWRARVAGEERERFRARTVGELRARAGLYLDVALTLRRAGAPMRKVEEEYLPQLAGIAAEVEREAPELAEPRYHLGRMLRALMRFDDALAEQDRALARNPEYSPSLYERVVLTARAYGARMVLLRARALAVEAARSLELRPSPAEGSGVEEARLVLPADEALEREDPEAAALRGRLDADLARLERRTAADTAQGLAVSLTPARSSCARGLAVAYRATGTETAERARKPLEAAVRADPTIEEAYEGLARLEELARDWEKAVAAYARGLEQDRGYIPFWIGRAKAYANWLAQEAGRPEAWRKIWDQAATSLERVVEVAPASAEAWTTRGELWMHGGNLVARQGKDPSSFYTRALSDLEKSLELAPNAPGSWATRGGVRVRWAAFELAHAQDPTPRLQAAQADLDRALELNPGLTEAWLSRGSLRRGRGHWAAQHGEDPEAEYGRSLADLAQALRLAPGLAPAWHASSQTRSALGDWRRDHAGEAASCYEAAASDLTRAADLLPASSEYRRDRGRLHAKWGDHVAKTGGDPMPLYRSALADYDQATDLAPLDALLAWERGALRRACADQSVKRGEDASALYRDARADFDRVLRALVRSTAGAEVRCQRGIVGVNWGRALRKTGGDPEPVEREAAADLSKALELKPGYPDALVWRGILRHRREEWPGAVKDFEEALRKSPALEKTVGRLLAEARDRLAGRAGKAAGPPAEGPK
ncbi:MAG: protein kinase [Planctomycetes bacterium]|nr:protein kinase [Planctomycetota bacterium]